MDTSDIIDRPNHGDYDTNDALDAHNHINNHGIDSSLNKNGHLKIDHYNHDRFKLELDHSSSYGDSVTSRSITLSQPTPPHSTDSSAPLSPLPSDKSSTFSKLSDNNKGELQEFISGDFSLETHETKETDSIHEARAHTDNTFRSQVCLTGVANLPQFHESSIPSPWSPCKDRTISSLSVSSCSEQPLLTSTAPAANSSLSVSCITTSISFPSIVTVGPKSTFLSLSTNSGISSFAAGNLSNNVINIVTSREESVAPCADSSQGIIRGSADTGGSSTAASPSFSPFKSNTGRGIMGCTLPQVEHTVAGRCAAPQPNDTPPPSSLPPIIKMTQSTAALPATDLNNYDNIFPDDAIKTLDTIMSHNTDFLNQLGTSNYAPESTVGSMSTAHTTIGGNLPQPLLSTSNCVMNTSGNSCRASVGGDAVTAVTAGVTAAPLVASAVTAGLLTEELQASQLVSALEVKQLRLQKRRSQLLRRVRRVTGRGLAANVSTQLQNLLLYGNILLHGKDAVVEPLKSLTSESPATTTVSVAAALPDYDTTTMKTMSTANLVSYIRDRERKSNARCGSNNFATNNYHTRSSDVNKSKYSSATIAGGEDTVACLPSELRNELVTVSGEVGAAARFHVEHDSDATESSSGGESCDEMDGYGDNLRTHSKPM